MTELITSLEPVIDRFDVAVLDQWGVLHDGTSAYPHALRAIDFLHAKGKQIAVLSNSGKRSELNRLRIEKLGVSTKSIAHVITSGETLRDDLIHQRLEIQGVTPHVFYPIAGSSDDPVSWAEGTPEISFVDVLNETVQAVLLMGLPDNSHADAYRPVLREALAMRLPLICSNPDKTAPRAGGLVVSPGALAAEYEVMGGEVVWYGKPHAAVFHAVRRCYPDTPSDRFLMVGDSLEHDIHGARQAAFLSMLVRGGIHARDFKSATSDVEIAAVLRRLCREKNAQPPDFSLEFLA